MATQFEKNLNEIFDIDGEIVSEETKDLPAIQKETKEEDIENDYDFARKNLYDVIGKGTDALDHLIELAKVSEHPRAFEVVATLSKTLMDANKDLLNIQKKVKDLQKEEEAKGGDVKNVTNALFVGSTAEMLKMLKDEKTEE